MRISKIASTGALGTVLHYAPVVSALLIALTIVVTAVFLRWFVRQSKPIRADVIRLIRTLRGD